ncbi:pseudaminic acid cytidylyltransferase [Microcystis elabens FACHB-917]|nr:pseudaminic acid cytidylyltransferase [Microcystis elabens FACHB-917]
MGTNICVIPARGGSKRIPRKNIRQFHGRPMIAWSIAAARASGCFERIIVSTDDEEIAAVAIACGGEVPFLRPAHLADDYATTQDVVVHALQWCEQQALPVQAVCCLYATAPFVQAEDLSKAASLFERGPAQGFVFAATSFPFPIQRAFRIDATGSAVMFHPEYINARSQDLEEAYHDAGQFYWGSSSAWSSTRNLFHDGSPLLLPRWRVQDIDTEEDWVRAELLHHILFTLSQ